MADTATFSGAMRTDMIGPIRDILPKNMVLMFGDPNANPTDFKGILPSAENINDMGNGFRIPMQVGRNPGVGFRHENEYLPAPGADEYSFLEEPLRYGYALFNITGQLMRAAESNAAAFVSAFKASMNGTLLASKLNFNRAAWGDGTGTLATYVSGSTTTSIVVDTTIYFRGLGEIVDIVAPTTGVPNNANSAARTVLAVTRSTQTLTLDAAPTVASGNIFVSASADSTSSIPNNSWNREINGLQNIVDDTSKLHGFNPSTYSFWKSYVEDVSGPVSDSVLRNAKDQVGFEAGLDVDTGLDYCLITTRGIRARYAETLTGLKQFVNAESTTLHGGFTALMFDENPMFTEDACPIGNVFGLALNKLFWAQQSDWDWMDQDGQVLKCQERRDRYIAILYKYCNLGTTWRAPHFRLTGLDDDVR